MTETDLDIRVKELSEKINILEAKLELLKVESDEMWDNSDMMRRWKVSRRTLATWRAEGVIDYVQIGGKVWYTKENRDLFILKNTIRGKTFNATACCN